MPPLPILALLLAAAAPDTTVYACHGAEGRVTYQDKPCPRAQAQRTIDLPDVPTMAPTPGALATPAPTASAPPTAPSAPPEAAPIPVMYACVRATDGSRYTSTDGQPPAYQVPYGVLGGTTTLSEAYGATQGRAGISAPEANRGRVTAGMIGNYYVWVQDSCQPMRLDEACRALRDDYDANARKLSRAFKSDRAPLEQRDRELRAQLRGC